MAPGVAVPVLAIVDEPLRADLALGALVGAAAHVRDPQPLAVEHGVRDQLEVRQRDLARTEVDDADPPLHLLGAVLARAEQAPQAREQRLDVRLEEARLQVREQVLHRQQRADLGGVEPETRELVAVRFAAREPVAAGVAVPLDRRVEPVAHVLEIALEGRPRDAELVEQRAQLHRAARGEQLVDLVEAFGAVHPVISPRREVPRVPTSSRSSAINRGDCKRLSHEPPASARGWQRSFATPFFPCGKR